MSFQIATCRHCGDTVGREYHRGRMAWYCQTCKKTVSPLWIEPKPAPAPKPDRVTVFTQALAQQIANRYPGVGVACAGKTVTPEDTKERRELITAGQAQQARLAFYED